MFCCQLLDFFVESRDSFPQYFEQLNENADNGNRGADHRLIMSGGNGAPNLLDPLLRCSMRFSLRQLCR